jgi:putative Mn2+ efflux pump MntP
LITLLLLAVALATDAFAVSVCQGAATRPGPAQAARLAIAFGLAQAVMPLLGWALGRLFAGQIEAIDHWLAFALLAILGAKMIYEGMTRDEDCPPDPLAGRALLAAALATSVDAAAAGITLSSLGVPVALACAAIGVVTAILCFIGALFGARIGIRFGDQAEIGGGLVLIALGFSILIDHIALAAGG